MNDLLDKSLQEADETLAELISNMPEDKRQSIIEELERNHPDWDIELLLKDQIPQPAESSQFEKILLNKEDDKSRTQIADNASDASRLTNEEKEFFFGEMDATEDEDNPEITDGVFLAGNEFEVPDEGEVEVSVVEQDAAIYEDLMVSPILRDSRRLLYLNMCVLCTILLVMAIIGFQQSQIIMRMEKPQDVTAVSQDLKVKESDTDLPWKFFLLSGEQQRLELKQRLDSNLTSGEEKVYCYSMLATLAFQEGDWQQGRKYLLEGMQLKNELQEAK
tara:strand:- start:959 stop:1786 length:828 start_codon:yes stop_codon:yes gene_type:complete